MLVYGLPVGAEKLRGVAYTECMVQSFKVIDKKEPAPGLGCGLGWRRFESFGFELEIARKRSGTLAMPVGETNVIQAHGRLFHKQTNQHRLNEYPHIETAVFGLRKVGKPCF